MSDHVQCCSKYMLALKTKKGFDDDDSTFNKKLPAEILEKIFANLSLHQQLIARQVCKRWSKVINSSPDFLGRVILLLDFGSERRACWAALQGTNLAWTHLKLKCVRDNLFALMNKKVCFDQKAYERITSLKFERGMIHFSEVMSVIGLFPNLRELAFIQCDIIQESPVYFCIHRMHPLERKHKACGRFAREKRSVAAISPVLKNLERLELEYAYMGELEAMLVTLKGVASSLHTIQTRFEPTMNFYCLTGYLLYQDMFEAFGDFVGSNAQTLKNLDMTFSTVNNWEAVNQYALTQLTTNQQILDGITTFGSLTVQDNKISKSHHMTYWFQASSPYQSSNDANIILFALQLKNLKHFNFMVKLHKNCPEDYMNLLLHPNIINKIRYLYINLDCRWNHVKQFSHVEHLELYCGHCWNDQAFPGAAPEIDEIMTIHLSKGLAVYFYDLRVLHLVEPMRKSRQKNPVIVTDEFMEIISAHMEKLECLIVGNAGKLTDGAFICKHSEHGVESGPDCKHLCNLQRLEELELRKLVGVTDLGVEHGFKFAKLKKLSVTGIPPISEETIMKIAENNRQLELCTLGWTWNSRRRPNRLQLSKFRQEFKEKLIYIQNEKLELIISERQFSLPRAPVSRT